MISLNIFQRIVKNIGGYVLQHLIISAESLFTAGILGIILGFIAYQFPKLRSLATNFSQGLRVIPSLGILFILIPIFGVGELPAIILNTLVGFTQIPAFLLETGKGLGMTKGQLMKNVSFPLATPFILSGIKVSLVEIIAIATVGVTINAGGLGTIRFEWLRRLSLIKPGWGIILTVGNNANIRHA